MFGDVTARFVLRATEGFTARLPGQRRTLLPMNSSMIVTEPLSEAAWQEIGWAGREAIGDSAHVYMYAQRTEDGRIAIGGRGIPYRFGSTLDHRGATQPETIDTLGRILGRLFPAAAGARIDHAWCGVLGVPRDWCATVTLDRASGLGGAGGYTGHGVAASNLAGHTLADLVAGEPTRAPRCPGSGTAPAPGSRSRCAGPGCTACTRCTGRPTASRTRVRTGPRRWPASGTGSPASRTDRPLPC